MTTAQPFISSDSQNNFDSNNNQRNNNNDNSAGGKVSRPKRDFRFQVRFLYNF